MYLKVLYVVSSLLFYHPFIVNNIKKQPTMQNSKVCLRKLPNIKMDPLF